MRDRHTFIYLYDNGTIKTSSQKDGLDLCGDPIKPLLGPSHGAQRIIHVHPNGRAVVLKDRLGHYQGGQVLDQLRGVVLGGGEPEEGASGEPDDISVHFSADGVTAQWQGRPGTLERGTCDLQRVGDTWWCTRVLVQGGAEGVDVRGRGVGTRLLQRALARAAMLGAKEVFVGPGGYGGDERRQRSFYTANGFAPAGDGLPDVVMVWRPQPAPESPA
jgi:GNAT superfamily N-acetyltransferase